MKLRYLFIAAVACLALAAGCTADIVGGDLKELQVSESILTVPMTGGQVTTTFNATETWAFDEKTVPEWLSISPAQGGAGETAVTFSVADGAVDTRSAEIKVNCGGKTQYFTFTQPGDPSLKPQFDAFEEGDYWLMFNTNDGWQVAQFVGGAYGYIYTSSAVVNADGSLSSIAANVYTFKAVDGGFTMQDSEGKYYYMTGTYDSVNTSATRVDGDIWNVEQFADEQFYIINAAKSKKMQFDPNYSSIGVYDSQRGIYPFVVKAQDPTPELIVIDAESFDMEIPGGDLVVPATVGSALLSVECDAPWIHYSGVKDNDGTALYFTCDENKGGKRAATVVVTCTDGTIVTVDEFTVNQEGSIFAVTAKEFNDAEVGTTLYKVTGVVSRITNAEKGQYYVKDATGEVYAYHLGLAADNTTYNVKDKLNVGDIVTVVGERGVYNTTIEMINGYLESRIETEAVTAAEFNAKEVSTDKWYRLEGTVSNVAKADSYGTFDLVDESGSAYVYKIFGGYTDFASKTYVDGINTKILQVLDIADGDKIVVIGQRGDYKGSAQAVNSMYVSHEKAAPEEPEEPEQPEEPGLAGSGTQEDPYVFGINYKLGASSYDDSFVIVDGKYYKEVKIGTGSKTGSYTLTVPKGTSKVSFYAVAWSGKKCTLKITATGLEKTLELTANSGASGNGPFTITPAAGDYYTIDLGTALPADVEVTVESTQSSNGRAIFWGVKTE